MVAQMSIVENREKIRILVVSSSPRNLGSLKVDQETKEIKKSLDYVNNLNIYVLIQEHATTIDDFYTLLKNFKPTIVHFCGHGQKSGIYLQDKNGISTLVSSDSLAKVFNYYSNYIKCVVLNSCYSESQATAISESIPYVIGTSQEIRDKYAVIFSKEFYSELKPDLSFETAFDHAVLRLTLESEVDSDKFVLYINSKKVKFLRSGIEVKDQEKKVFMQDESLSRKTQQIIGFLFGTLFIITLIILAIIIPDPSTFQYTTFRVILSIAAAGCAVMLPGFLEVTISNIVRAGGALGVFIIVYFYNPASNIVEKLNDAKPSLNNPGVIDFRTIEKYNENNEFVVSSEFSYENKAEPAKTAKINTEKINFFINGKKFKMKWRYFVDQNIGRSGGWLGIKATAAPFSINQGTRDYHETLFVQDSNQKVSWKDFVKLLDAHKGDTLIVTLSSNANNHLLTATCVADMIFYRRQISAYRKKHKDFVNYATLPCENTRRSLQASEPKDLFVQNNQSQAYHYYESAHS